MGEAINKVFKNLKQKFYVFLVNAIGADRRF